MTDATHEIHADRYHATTQAIWDAQILSIETGEPVRLVTVRHVDELCDELHEAAEGVDGDAYSGTIESEDGSDQRWTVILVDESDDDDDDADADADAESTARRWALAAIEAGHYTVDVEAAEALDGRRAASVDVIAGPEAHPAVAGATLASALAIEGDDLDLESDGCGVYLGLRSGDLIDVWQSSEDYITEAWDD